MFLLASGISREQFITVIVLCAAVILFVVFDVALVISLHKRDKRLERRKKLIASIQEKVMAEKAKKAELEESNSQEPVITDAEPEEKENI